MKSSRSGLVISLIGVAIPLLALVGAVIGFGYQAESKRILAQHPSLDRARRDQLSDAVPRFKRMGIAGAVVLLMWVLVIAGIMLTLE